MLRYTAWGGGGVSDHTDVHTAWGGDDLSGHADVHAMWVRDGRRRRMGTRCVPNRGAHGIESEDALVKRFAWILLVAIAFCATTLAPVAAAPGDRCFPETGQCFAGRFREYWDGNGGLSVFGFPIAGQRTEQGSE